MPNERYTYALVMAVFLLSSFAVHGHAQEADERQRLVERRDRLRTRIARLLKERDFLLFRKEMYSADSKYLVLDPVKGSGVLRYRDRAIRNFRFSRKGVSNASLRPGAFVMTVREERGGKRRSLVFGDAFALQTRRARAAGGRGTAPARFVISVKDMSSLFYALDAGSRAYVVSR